MPAYDSLEILNHDETGTVPNHPTLPQLIYHTGLDPGSAPNPGRVIADRFEENGWSGIWFDGIYPFGHYHTTAHEVLGMARGEARVRFGGSAGPVKTLSAGDVTVLPAGVGHQRLDCSGDYLVVGGYPRGQEADLVREEENGGSRESHRDSIRAVPLPRRDPVHGEEGPLLDYWQE